MENEEVETAEEIKQEGEAEQDVENEVVEETAGGDVVEDEEGGELVGGGEVAGGQEDSQEKESEDVGGDGTQEVTEPEGSIEMTGGITQETGENQETIEETKTEEQGGDDALQENDDVNESTEGGYKTEDPQANDNVEEIVEVVEGEGNEDGRDEIVEENMESVAVEENIGSITSEENRGSVGSADNRDSALNEENGESIKSDGNRDSVSSDTNKERVTVEEITESTTDENQIVEDSKQELTLPVDSNKDQEPEANGDNAMENEIGNDNVEKSVEGEQQHFKTEERQDVKDAPGFRASVEFSEPDSSPRNRMVSDDSVSPRQGAETPMSQRKSTRFSSLEPWREQGLVDPLPPLGRNRLKPIQRPHEWIYKPASTYVRDVMAGVRAPCKNQHLVNRYAGPSRRTSRDNRHWLQSKCFEERDVNWLRPNPAITVPLRAHRWKRTSWLPPPKSGGEEWTIQAKREQARKDNIRAQKLGYETLVGNIVYIDIPGARNLNRSWKHFLDRNPMAWGFPYTTGSTERPSLPLPSPYLVHQLKESMWKFPKNKFLHSANE